MERTLTTPMTTVRTQNAHALKNLLAEAGKISGVVGGFMLFYAAVFALHTWLFLP